ncbi:1,4-alpha-glucan branching protein domain-containing protein [Thermosulfuriphilus sp.]
MNKVVLFSGQLLGVELLGPKALVSWPPVSFSPDEDLYLEVIKDETTLAEHRVSHLQHLEIDLPSGQELILALWRKRRLEISVSSTFHYTPHVVFISENERRHHLSWGNIDWRAVRAELKVTLGLALEETRACLKILRHPDPLTNFPEEEWQEVGLSDRALVLGLIKAIELHLLDQRGQSLKRLFSLRLIAPQRVAEVDRVFIRVPEEEAYLYLTRKVVEPDELQLKAFWHIPESLVRSLEAEFLQPQGLPLAEVDFVLRLFWETEEGLKEFRPEERRAIGLARDWIFPLMPSGLYQAKLSLETKEGQMLAEVLESNFCYLTPSEERIVLLPIDEYRLFTYWHLDQKRLASELSRFASGHALKIFIRLYEEFAGELYPRPEKDIEVHLGLTNNWYLHLEPDKCWRVQLLAVRDDGKTLELTPPSNPAQTGRLATGGNPVVYKTVDRPLEHPTIRPIKGAMDPANHSIGLLILHLHAHLPYLRRRIVYGEAGYWQPMGYPEEWFHEALVDTYIPLVDRLGALIKEGVDFKLSMDISPALSNMMRCPLLQEEFLRYIEALINLARAEVERTMREEPHYTHAAWVHLERFERAREVFLSWGGDLTQAFKDLQDRGYLEISTCAATHAFLPFYLSHKEGIYAQVETAIRDYEETFGRAPVGIWLPECAYHPGLEEVLDHFGLRYFFSETHTVLLADSPVEFGYHAPVYIKGSNVAIFPRDPETGKQVWSGEEGYPGDPDYLEFHIKGGPLRYNRVTDRRSQTKEPYNRDWALSKAANHAQHFMEGRNFRFEYVRGWYWKKPLTVATYDAELFGHHWFEGPDFLYFLLKKIYYNQNQTELITPADYLSRYPTNQDIFPPPSSWGDKGTFDKWMYGSVSWMYRHIHEAISALRQMNEQADSDEYQRRILVQASREVLWAMNSDLAFVISNGHFIDRMKEFFFEALENFWWLRDLFYAHKEKGAVDEGALRLLEISRPIFPALNPQCFASRRQG